MPLNHNSFSALCPLRPANIGAYLAKVVLARRDRGTAGQRGQGVSWVHLGSSLRAETTLVSMSFITLCLLRLTLCGWA